MRRGGRCNAPSDTLELLDNFSRRNQLKCIEYIYQLTYVLEICNIRTLLSRQSSFGQRFTILLCKAQQWCGFYRQKSCLRYRRHCSLLPKFSREASVERRRVRGVGEYFLPRCRLSMIIPRPLHSEMLSLQDQRRALLFENVQLFLLQ